MREDKNENRWDKLIQIHTMGRDDSRSDLYRYPYADPILRAGADGKHRDDPKGKYAARLRMRKGPRGFLLIGADPVPVHRCGV